MSIVKIQIDNVTSTQIQNKTMLKTALKMFMLNVVLCQPLLGYKSEF